MGYHSVCESDGRVILRDRMLSVTTTLVTWSGFIHPRMPRFGSIFVFWLESGHIAWSIAVGGLR